MACEKNAFFSLISRGLPFQPKLNRNTLFFKKKYGGYVIFFAIPTHSVLACTWLGTIRETQMERVFLSCNLRPKSLRPEGERGIKVTVQNNCFPIQWLPKVFTITFMYSFNLYSFFFLYSSIQVWKKIKSELDGKMALGIMDKKRVYIYIYI